jgi:hypothetical protein
MALSFTVTTAQTLLGAGVASRAITITLTGTGSLGSTATFTPAGLGSFSPAAPTIASGGVPGDSVTFTYTPTARGGRVVVTASGGLTGSQTLTLPVASPRQATARKIIDAALAYCAARALGERRDGAELMDALADLNAMIDLMRTDSLYAYAVETVTGTIDAGSLSATIGPSGDIITKYRPIRLEPGSFFTSGSVDYEITPMAREQYERIGYKTLATLGPQRAHYEAGVPNGTLYFYPQSAGEMALSLQMLVELEEFADLTTLYTLAPGVEMLLGLKLAEYLAPKYQKTLAPGVAMLLTNAERSVRRVNFRVPELRMPVARGNILIGWEN